MCKYYLEGGRLQGDCHLYLKNKLRFPDYYGENLDALYDCLSQITDHTQIFIEESSQAAGEILAVFKEAEQENSCISLSL